MLFPSKKTCKRREGVRGLEGKALQSQVQACLSTCTQMYLEIFAVLLSTDWSASSRVSRRALGKAVLAKGTGLEQYGSALHRIGIYQRYTDLVGADPVNQSRDVFG